MTACSLEISRWESAYTMITEEIEPAVHEAGWNRCEPSSLEAQSHEVFHIKREKEKGKKKKPAPRLGK